MKRRDLVQHLRQCGCLFLREGSKHSVYYHPLSLRTSTVPRHREINDFLAPKICPDLGIVDPFQTRQ